MSDSDYHDEGKGPLKSEALARDKWRGKDEATLSKRDAVGHTLPESEAAPEPDDGGGGRPNPIAGTMLSPD